MKLQGIRVNKSLRLVPKRALWVGILAASAAIILAPAVGGGLQSRNPVPHNSPEIIRAPDANEQNDINSQQTEKENFDAANAERKKQIAADSAKLLKLANDLKTEVDKTTKDTLSLNVIRKADEIEKLAHDVKEKMKLTVGPA
jgi:hypothetical protein